MEPGFTKQCSITDTFFCVIYELCFIDDQNNIKLVNCVCDMLSLTIHMLTHFGLKLMTIILVSL